ncbi:MAG: hypothetical protein PUA90_00095 [bacterium]|nr:hypothetical protein [bacterium]
MSTIINFLIFGGPVLSTGLHLFKNNIAKNIIERDGFVITKDNRSLSEKISTIIKNYAYVIVPVYNLVKSVRLFIKNDKVYASERRSDLDSCGRIKTKEETIKEDKKPNVAKVETIEEKPTINNNIVPEKLNTVAEINELINQVSNSDDISFLYQIKFTYKSRSMMLREEHKNKRLSGKVKASELNALADRIDIYDRVFIAARDRLKYIKSQSMSKKLQ